MKERSTIDPPKLPARPGPGWCLHGKQKDDEYAWLREVERTELAAYLEEEARYASSITSHLRDLEGELFREMKERLPASDHGAPVSSGSFLYSWCEEPGLGYRIHYRVSIDGTHPREILLDENELASDHTFFRLGAFEVSPDGLWLAYATDTTGDERMRLAIKDLHSGKLLLASLAITGGSIAWSRDSRSLFFNVLDEKNRPWRICRFRPGDSEAGTKTIFEESDEAFHASVTRSESDRFLMIVSASQTTSETHLVDLQGSTEESPTCFLARQPGVMYSLTHQGNSFFLLTNEGAESFWLATMPCSATERSFWIPVLPPRPDVSIEQLQAFADFLVVFEWHDGVRRARVFDTRRGEAHRIELGCGRTCLYPEPNRRYESTVLRIGYTALETPYSVVEYDMKSRTTHLLKRLRVRGDYSPSDYRTERIFARSQDGTRVPISLMYRRDLEREGGLPTVLYGYGAYGVSIEPSFCPLRLSLLDRGLLFAIAHIRGGGEMGVDWHEQGRQHGKSRTVEDFIACAEELVQSGFSARDQMAAMSESAGGAMLGAVANRRPELFSALVTEVPFVDLVNTLADPDLPLTAAEWEEWGDPRNPEDFASLLALSPYENVEPRPYPAMLITVSPEDPRVPYWEPIKWLARLRRAQRIDRPLLLREVKGHGGDGDRFQELREAAFIYSFLLDRLKPAGSGGREQTQRGLSR